MRASPQWRTNHHTGLCSSVSMIRVLVGTQSSKSKDMPLRRNASGAFEQNIGADIVIPSPTESESLRAVTWNIAAPNNNPFEFWIHHDDPRYHEMMQSLQRCLDHPELYDVRVGDVFTQNMFLELRNEMAKQGGGNLDKLDDVWTILVDKRFIGDFLNSKALGEKRLISIPDRITSSVKNENGVQVFRPSPITGNLDDIEKLPTWWMLWKEFMFKIMPVVRCNKKPSVFSLLKLIPRAKYPALTEAEEAMSIPLQTLCLALFDAAFTHLLSRVAPETWQPIKRSLHQALFQNKAASCVGILQRSYADADVVFVQEASDGFSARAMVGLNHLVLRATGVDGRRPQVSLILANRARFKAGSERDLTEAAIRRVEGGVCVEPGDLCVFEATAHDGGRFLLASFHGDSAGRSTGPVLAGLHALARERCPGHILVFGLDANTAFSGPDAGGAEAQLGVDLAGRGLASCWRGRGADEVWTTFSARTALQPQLHKAVRPGEVGDRRHRRLKDWILFYDAQLALVAAERDNGGDRSFRPARDTPSLAFPSDHAIVSASFGISRRPRSTSLPVSRC